MRRIKHAVSHIYTLMLVFALAMGIQTFADEGLKVHFLNVGQADSTLITCGSHAMLIDAGNNDDEEPILNYIQNKQGITHLDYVIGTHPHEDHIGAMDSVLYAVSTDEVMLPEVTTNTQTFMDVLTAIDDQGLAITVPEPGETYTLGDASFTILSPNGDYGTDLNNWSIALRLTYGNTSFLFTGDAETDAEQDILNTGLTLSSDVYQVGHHGSSSSSSQAFLEAVQPRYAVISCGQNNDYGHPHKETLDALTSRGIEIFRTDLQGTIVAASDGTNISFGLASSGNNTSSQDLVVVENKDSSSQSSDPTVHITKTGEKYHSAGCQYLKKSDIEVTLSEAKARGLTPCSKCNPPS